ncbi:hypothetical protein NMY22_g9924 [Coprinellus aureogranulatus]|nr:hypothetical protein NMY22_g9924 [Coprinellus aureogranulatus]
MRRFYIRWPLNRSTMRAVSDRFSNSGTSMTCPAQPNRIAWKRRGRRLISEASEGLDWVLEGEVLEVLPAPLDARGCLISGLGVMQVRFLPLPEYVGYSCPVSVEYPSGGTCDAPFPIIIPQHFSTDGAVVPAPSLSTLLGVNPLPSPNIPWTARLLSRVLPSALLAPNFGAPRLAYRFGHANLVAGLSPLLGFASIPLAMVLSLCPSSQISPSAETGDSAEMGHAAETQAQADKPFVGTDPKVLREQKLKFLTVSSHTIRFCDLVFYDAWGTQVRAAGEAWRTATTKVERKALVKKNGVRYSSLHQLPYLDPVLHVVLGVMHNWLEGVLQHHVRMKWGLGIPKGRARVVPVGDGSNSRDGKKCTGLGKARETSNRAPGLLDDEEEETISQDEIEDLHAENQPFGPPTAMRRTPSSASSMQEPDHDSYMGDPDDDEFQPSANEDEGQDEEDSDEDDGEVDSDDEDEAVKSKKVVSIFAKDELAGMHSCIANTALPSWVERPPTNLGEPSHGKLKAEQWLILFTVFFPLILAEIWTTKSLGPELAESESLGEKLLDNFHDLVLCTNIVCADAVSAAMADEYTAHYIRYRQSSAVLFPHLKSRPNHHYAMHNGDQMKFFGPLMKLSELGYERHDGRLQKVKTNGHPGEQIVYSQCVYRSSTKIRFPDMVCNGTETYHWIAFGVSDIENANRDANEVD